MIARILALAVVATCLIAAAPALAKVKAKAKAKTAQGAAAITTLPFDASELPEAAPAVRIDGARFSQETPRNVFRELPGGIEAGVGIYSVLGAAERTRHTARTDPMRDLLPRQKRMAAVGLKLSF